MNSHTLYIWQRGNAWLWRVIDGAGSHYLDGRSQTAANAESTATASCPFPLRVRFTKPSNVIELAEVLS